MTYQISLHSHCSQKMSQLMTRFTEGKHHYSGRVIAVSQEDELAHDKV